VFITPTTVDEITQPRS